MLSRNIIEFVRKFLHQRGKEEIAFCMIIAKECRKVSLILFRFGIHLTYHSSQLVECCPFFIV
jgi:hypothetical protein